jgi:hypothetical protein
MCLYIVFIYCVYSKTNKCVYILFILKRTNVFIYCLYIVFILKRTNALLYIVFILKFTLKHIYRHATTSPIEITKCFTDYFNILT